jgi:hypothetical protein
MTQAEATGIVQLCRYLARDPNVVSLSVGWKRRGGRVRDELALVVGVRGKRSHRRIPKGYRIPEFVNIDGIPLRTDVIPLRRKRFSVATRATGSTPARIHARGGSHGTLGAFLTDQTGRQFILSCSHVLTDFGRFSVLDHPIEDAASDRRIARLRRFTNLIPGADNSVDAALAEVSDTRLRERVPLPVVPSIADVEQDERLWLLDRQAGRSGIVTRLGIAEKAYGWANDQYEYCWMVGQVEVSDLGQGGDSGSLVVNAGGQAVGLYVVDSGARDLMTPIARVLDALGDPATCVAGANDQNVLRLAWA